MEPEPQSAALNFDPNGPGMGLDLDFSDFDIQVDPINVDRHIGLGDIANFGFNNVFNNFDLGGLDIDNGMNYSANFNFEYTLKEAELSLGPHETFQEANTNLSSLSPGHLLPLELRLANEKSDALTLQVSEASNPGTSTCQEPVINSNEMRAQKRKKMDEVDQGHILPEGSRRNRNKTAQARGVDTLA
jgi:hypothetical protein